MPITHAESGTRIDEIEDGIYRVSVPVPEAPGGFTFNQFLVADEEPLLFHTGPRRSFPLVRDAVATVLPPARLRWIAFSHVEGDECGSLREWLDAAPHAAPVCSRVAGMVYAEDATERAPRVLADGDVLPLGRRSVRWFDAPHVPHGWECGYLGELATRTLLCGDLFTQAGARHPPVTESEILGPSETMRASMDYFARGPGTRPALERLAAFEPRLLACMHGAAYRGDGAAHLRALADALDAGPR